MTRIFSFMVAFVMNNLKLVTMTRTEIHSANKIGRFLIFCFLINVVIFLFLCPQCYTDFELFKSNWDDFLYSYLMTCFLSGGISEIIRKADEHFPWLDAPLNRLIFDLITVTTYSFIVSFCLATIFTVFVWDVFTIETIDWYEITRSTKLPILIALGITVFFTSRSFLLEWRQAAIEAEQMRSERLAGQYQSLKDQLNPHFLFNSLNVLSNLVYEDADQANAFIEKLSKIYRYVLDVQYEEVVDLEKELAFAGNFLELQKLRFGEKLAYEIEVKDENRYTIPPLTLQLLLENAIKHNIATRSNPLVLRIYADGENLVVENNLQKRESHTPESGIGLTNIHQRYKYLTNKEVVVSETEDKFLVEVPLLNKSPLK